MADKKAGKTRNGKLCFNYIPLKLKEVKKGEVLYWMGRDDRKQITFPSIRTLRAMFLDITKGSKTLRLFSCAENHMLLVLRAGTKRIAKERFLSAVMKKVVSILATELALTHYQGSKDPESRGWPVGYSRWILKRTDDKSCSFPSEEKLQELFSNVFPSAKLQFYSCKPKHVLIIIPVGTKLSARKKFLHEVAKEMLQ